MLANLHEKGEIRKRETRYKNQESGFIYVQLQSFC